MVNKNDGINGISIPHKSRSVGHEGSHAREQENKIEPLLIVWGGLKIPGELGYQSHHTWVSKRIEEWCVSTYLFVYVGDKIPIDPSLEDFFKASNRWGSGCTYGNPGATRNLKPLYQQPGPWEGTVTHT